jgi:hypothetical protein
MRRRRWVVVVVVVVMMILMTKNLPLVLVADDDNDSDNGAFLSSQGAQLAGAPGEGGYRGESEHNALLPRVLRDDASLDDQLGPGGGEWSARWWP